MENKEFRNALVEAMKNELKDFVTIQRELKKSRKEQYRPKDKYLQDIVDEIRNNANKIFTLLSYYRWIKHGLKYWANRGINSFKEYKFIKLNDDGFDSSDYYYKNWDTVFDYGVNKGKTRGDFYIAYAKQFYIQKCNEYGLDYGTKVTEENIDYLIQNV